MDTVAGRSRMARYILQNRRACKEAHKSHFVVIEGDKSETNIVQDTVVLKSGVTNFAPPFPNRMHFPPSQFYFKLI